MSKRTIYMIMIFSSLVCACVCCGGQAEDGRKSADSETIRETVTGKEDDAAADREQPVETSVSAVQTDPENARLLCLANADTETLFGLNFGDRVDYSRFETCGFHGSQPIFRETNGPENGLYFYFHGENRGFSGFMVNDERLDFLGLDRKTDKLDRLTGLFGRADELEKDGSVMSVKWNFGKARLEAVAEKDHINYIRYLAPDGAADGEDIPWERSDLAQDCRAPYDYTENIYQWEATHGSYANATEASYHPYDDDYDAGQVRAFIEEYLEKQGIRKTEPDGTVCNQRGEPLVEYYIEEATNQYCFVVHLWGDYWIDYAAGISEYQDAVYCTAHVVQDADRIGTFLYGSNEERGITRERLYDTEGMCKADLSYQVMPDMPFATVTDYWYLDSGYDAGSDVLCRGQKFCFDEGRSEVDEAGRFIRYQALCGADDEEEAAALSGASELYALKGGTDIMEGFYDYPCTLFYNQKGKLERIEEDLLPDDEEKGREDSGQAEFRYDHKGVVKEAVYQRSSWTQGTTDSSGMIEYDEQGRMIYNSYYITHGGHKDLFVYEEGAARPWARLRWCSFAPGFPDVTLFLKSK